MKITNHKTFEAALWVTLKPHAPQLLDEERARRLAARNSGAPSLPPKQSSREVLLLHRIWVSYREISESLDTLTSIPVYLGHFPSSLPRRITRLGWVRYHMENYFNELYVFQNRAAAFLKQLRRSYRSQSCVLPLTECCNKFEKVLKDSLSSVVAARGQHVHERRFDDTSLRIFGLVEHLVADGRRPRQDRTVFFEDIRMEKRHWMKSNNMELKKWGSSGESVGNWRAQR